MATQGLLHPSPGATTKFVQPAGGAYVSFLCRNQEIAIKQPLQKEVVFHFFFPRHDLRRLAQCLRISGWQHGACLRQWGAGGAGMCRHGWRHLAYMDVLVATLRNLHPTAAHAKPKPLHKTQNTKPGQPQIIPFFSCTHCLTSNITSAISSNSVATLNAATWLYSLYKISTCSGSVLVKPRM